MSVAALPGRVHAEPIAVCVECHHCGTPVADGTGAAGVPAYCCTGCEAASQWIMAAELGDYYSLRSASGAPVGSDAGDASVWDRDDLLQTHVRELAGEREITVLTDSMRCPACAWLIDRALTREPGVIEACANAVTGRIRIRWNPRLTPLSRPLSRLQSLGYRPFLALGETRERARREERKADLLRLGVAGLGAMQAMMFAEALFLDTSGQMPGATRDFLRWVTFLVSSPVVWYAGWPFISGALRELSHRRPGMDTLIAGSTLLAYFASLVETIRGGPHVWYDAAVMFVFLLLAARMLESRARRLANAQVEKLARATPVFATREKCAGERESIGVASLRVGDVVCLAAGEVVPADGELLDARGSFEEALLTGESSPVDRLAGDRVFAGTICRQFPVRLRVTVTGSATRLSQITRLVEQAQSHRPALASLADLLASRFFYVVLASAAATWLTWHFSEPSRAFEVALAVLAVSCPCALSLAVPATLAAAHGALARCGVLALDPDALPRLAGCTDLIFDKTGTLTNGEPKILASQALAGTSVESALAVCAALERDSGHPLARAFQSAQAETAATDVVIVAGEGVSGTINGEPWRLGRAQFAAGKSEDGAVWLGCDGVARARFEIQDELNPSAAEASEGLRALGLALRLSSGDSEAAVARCSQALGITGARSRQAPEDKLATIRSLQARGRRVAMVGDGINDAPVLAGADVSISIGSGAALARQSSDLVLMSDDLRRIPRAIGIARRSEAITRQNLGWALAYNLLAIPLAASGSVSPWMAAAGMAGSSLLVTANALRLCRDRPT